MTLEPDKYFSSLSSFSARENHVLYVGNEYAGGNLAQCHRDADTGSVRWDRELSSQRDKT